MLRRTQRIDNSQRGAWGAGSLADWDLTGPALPLTSAQAAALGTPLAFTQSREGTPRVVREVHATVGVNWWNNTASVNANVVGVLGRVVLIAGSEQALNGVTALYPGIDLRDRVDGRILFDSLITVQGLTAFRWSAESGPLVEADEYLTGLLAIPEASADAAYPTLPRVAYSVGSLSVATQLVSGGAGVTVGRVIDRG